MRMTQIRDIAADHGGQWYYTQKEVSVLMGASVKITRAFLVENALPHYLIGDTKKYFIVDIIEAIERRRWKETGRIDRRTTAGKAAP